MLYNASIKFISSNLHIKSMLRVSSLGVLLISLIACSGNQNNDTIRTGSGQESILGNSNSGNDFPIFYVKRTTPDITTTDDDVQRVRVVLTNADLYMLDRASSSGLETNITARVRGGRNEFWDVKDVDVSFDGNKVIFAMRGPDPDPDRDMDPPTWNIWEYEITTDKLHRIISSDVIADEGQDISPHYTVDGKILFTSTRQRQSKAILLDEGKSQFEAQDESRDESAFVLHIMDADGSNIRQLTFNQSHDLDPTVLTNGRIMWSRWNHANGRNAIHLYTANPDGTDVQLLYGGVSHRTIQDTDVLGVNRFPAVQFVKAHEMRDGRILTLVRPFSGTEFGGDLYIIDTNNYVENNQPVDSNSTLTGPAQTKVGIRNIRLSAGPSPQGRFNAAIPLWDGSNRILVSWTICRLIDSTQNNAAVPCTAESLADPSFTDPNNTNPTLSTALPAYGVFMFDPGNNSLLPIVLPVAGVMVSDIALAQIRSIPTFKTTNSANNPSIDQTLATEGVGILDIRSVYDFAGAILSGINIPTIANPVSLSYASRPARFLRIEKAVSQPSEDVRDIDNSAFGASNFMREIVGYIPIEPDGSVKVKVPADVALQISVLDDQGRRLASFSRHTGWLNVRPGETVQCNGCHTPTPANNGQSGISHGRFGSFLSAYAGATAVGQTFAGANTTFTAVDAGDTMAQARAAWSCANEQCRSITPSVNIIYSEVWPTGFDPKVIPTTPRSEDFAYQYTGSTGLSTPFPTSALCNTVWSSTCRVTINYEEHIQPLWDLDRFVDANNDNIPDLDGNGNPINNKCTGCHTRVDAANNTQVPPGQLELTTEPSEQDPDQFTSYRELLFNDNALELNGTILTDHCLQFAPDPANPLVQVCVQFETVARSLVALNAAGSSFFGKFSSGTHAGYLTAGELKLISEWVDIGAQYYNDPFQAPEN